MLDYSNVILWHTPLKSSTVHVYKIIVSIAEADYEEMERKLLPLIILHSGSGNQAITNKEQWNTRTSNNYYDDKINVN